MAPLLERFVGQLLEEYAARPRAWAAGEAGQLLADHAVCAAGGALVLPQRDRGPGEASALALPAGEAAAANAVRASALDRDDLHWPSVTHPGGVVWPVVLAVGERVSAPGHTAVLAAAVGYEVTTRLAAALGPVHRRLWHATATAGTVGGAVAGALVAGGDDAAAVRAAGHATSVAGGLVQTMFERSGTRLFHRAHAARTAVAAATAALDGLPATRAALEHPRGLFAAAAPGADPETVLTPHDDGWALARCTLRPYAASGFTHAAIDAACALGPLDAGSVRRVRVTVAPACLALSAEPHPADREAAWWSVQHAVAACLLSGDAGVLEAGGDRPEEGMGGRDPEVAALLRLIEVEADDHPSTLAATVEVETDGGWRRAAAELPSGHPDRPLSLVGATRKWAALLPGLGDHGAARIRAVCAAVGERPVPETVAGLAAALRPEGERWKGSRNR